MARGSNGSLRARGSLRITSGKNPFNPRSRSDPFNLRAITYNQPEYRVEKLKGTYVKTK